MSDQNGTGPKLIASANAQSTTAGNQTFQDAGRSPAAWLFNADRLKRAATLLLPEEDRNELMIRAIMGGLGNPNNPALQAVGEHMLKYVFVDVIALMLLGMSFENLIKGIIVAHDPSLVEQDKLGNELAEHKLDRLAVLMESKSGTSLSSDEIGFIHPLLTELVMWGGRYPIPIRAQHMLAQFSWTSETRIRMDQLWVKLNGILNSKIHS